MAAWYEPSKSGKLLKLKKNPRKRLHREISLYLGFVSIARAD